MYIKSAKQLTYRQVLMHKTKIRVRIHKNKYIYIYMYNITMPI